MYTWSPAHGRPPLPAVALPTVGQWATRAGQRQSPTGISVLQTDSVSGRVSSPPHRPVASSWQDRASDGRSTTSSDVVKLQHTTIEMIDLEGNDNPGTGGSEGEEEEEETEKTLQLARAMGAEKLYDAFHELHPDGHVPLAALPEVFEAAGLTTTLEEVESAVGKLCPEVASADSVPYPQCQEVFFHLSTEHQRSETVLLELAKAGCLARWMTTDNDATNLLLIIVVSLCGLSAFLAAAVAILLLFLDGISNANGYLQDDLGLVTDNIEVFALQIAISADNEAASMFATTLSVILEHIGFVQTVESTETNLLKMATSLSDTIAAWLSIGPLKAFISFAVVASALANNTLATHSLNETAHLFDELNPSMPADYEVMLSRWQDSNETAVEYLTQFRFSSQCPTGGCITNASVTAPMMEALEGSTFAQFVVDYTGSLSFAGFTNRSGLGFEVKLSKVTLMTKRFNLLSKIIQSWTSDATNSYEFLVANRTAAGVGCLLVPPNNCNAACMLKVLMPGWPMYYALLGQKGVMQFTNHRGASAIAAYMPVEGQPMGLVVQMELSGVIESTIETIASLLNSLNTQYAQGSEEFELSTFQVKGSNTNITHLTPYRYSAQCPSGKCVETPYVQQAVKSCSTGMMRTTDYRNVSVVVGYSCIKELNTVMSYKVDVSENEADNLDAIADALNARNANANDSSAQFVLAKPNAGLTAAEVEGYADFEVLTRHKYSGHCARANCSWNSESALRALEGQTDVIDTTDYRNVAVKSASVRSDAISYGIGLALLTDATEFLQSIVDTAIKVGCFSIGMVAGCTLVLILITKLFLRSMITAKEEGKKAVEKEKERFRKLVGSMYPAYVMPQLLAGEKQTVCEVPGAAVFFSDIHEFTSASNVMGSKDLLTLMGYVYGVMDHIADRFGVYKVKTIGDAYLAVLGLPGTTSANVSLDMLRFASCVCQVFGDRFVHPTEGQVLALMNNAMTWNGCSVAAAAAQRKHVSLASSSITNSVKGGGSAAQSMGTHSQLSGGRVGSKASSDAADASQGEREKVQCVMSYGLAVGKLVAGVLAGRSPMFDIWGNTVNLASRMQSTGEPGRIQVSEHLYHKVMAEPHQPFSFEAPHTVFCKGFGNVNAYMVRTTSEGLAKDLQDELKLEPQYGAFFFDSVLSMDAQAQVAQVLG